MKTIRMP